jgi:multisubunit Na+/H+ antiporter MnhB subunit
MRSTGLTIIIIGIIIVVMGVIFSLQSQSVVGPSSSFMYDNPEWSVNGSIIIGVGIIVDVIGGLVLFGVIGKKSNKIQPGG